MNLNNLIALASGHGGSGGNGGELASLIARKKELMQINDGLTSQIESV